MHSVGFQLYKIFEKAKLKNEEQIRGCQELEAGGWRMGGRWMRSLEGNMKDVCGNRTAHLADCDGGYSNLRT